MAMSVSPKKGEAEVPVTCETPRDKAGKDPKDEKGDGDDDEPMMTPPRRSKRRVRNPPQQAESGGTMTSPLKKVPKRLRTYAKKPAMENPPKDHLPEENPPKENPGGKSSSSKGPSGLLEHHPPSIACHSDPKDRVEKEDLAGDIPEKPSNDMSKADKQAEAKRKRMNKAKIAAQKLHANIPAGDIYAELCIPGPEIPSVSYTLYPVPGAEEYKPFTSPIGVILYTETFYVNDVKEIPKPLDQFIQVR